MSFSAEHLDDLSSARRPAVHATSLDPVTCAGVAVTCAGVGFNGLRRHPFTSFGAITAPGPEFAIGDGAKPAPVIYGMFAPGAEAGVRDQDRRDQPRASDNQQRAWPSARRQAGLRDAEGFRSVGQHRDRPATSQTAKESRPKAGLPSRGTQSRPLPPAGWCARSAQFTFPGSYHTADVPVELLLQLAQPADSRHLGGLVRDQRVERACQEARCSQRCVPVARGLGEH